MPIVSVTQVDRDHAAPAAIGAATITMQRAGAEQHRVAPCGHFVFGERKARILRALIGSGRDARLGSDA